MRLPSVESRAESSMRLCHDTDPGLRSSTDTREGVLYDLPDDMAMFERVQTDWDNASNLRAPLAARRSRRVASLVHDNDTYVSCGRSRRDRPDAREVRVGRADDGSSAESSEARLLLSRPSSNFLEGAKSSFGESLFFKRPSGALKGYYGQPFAVERGIETGCRSRNARWRNRRRDISPAARD